jgi:hypothetical protein
MKPYPLLIRLFLLAVTTALALALGACASLVPPPAASVLGATEARAAWARVLQRFVNERGEVDFAALAGDRRDLDTYLAYVAATPASGLGAGDERLAHYINSYNALSMFNVIDLGIPQSNASLGARYKFFIARRFQIGGIAQSLYDYENKVIRALNEPRIHWALNCSAVSCPALPRVPFEASQLQAQLDAEAVKFFANPSNFRVDHASREVWLSEIFSLFPTDFVPAHAESFTHYANRYAPVPAPTNYTIRITPYDWTIANSKRKKP